MSALLVLLAIALSAALPAAAGETKSWEPKEMVVGTLPLADFGTVLPAWQERAEQYVPYPDVIELLKGYFKIGDRDDHREMRAKVLGRVLGLDRGLEPLLPPLLALLDVPVEEAGWQNLDPPQRRQRTLDAVRRLLLRESQVQPLLVVFEDLHSKISI